mgnify:CR=1 FL=1
MEHGQPVALRMARLGDLLAIVLEPGNGFIHLVQDPEACVEAFGPYHISVCQMDLVADAELAGLKDRWDGIRLTLPISYVGRDGYMELADCPLTQDKTLHRLHFHPQAWYGSRAWHISG